MNKGATSFHASEEIWTDPLAISSNMLPEELSKLRKSWDLLIDIDSPFLDCSKIAAKLIIAALEQHGVKNYGLKFSGKKGYHIIVSGKAFPEEYNGMKMSESFPEWPRAICAYLMSHIKREYNKEVGKILADSDIEGRTSLKKEDLKEVQCTQCGKAARTGELVKLRCSLCDLETERRDMKITKRRLRCLNDTCAGILEVIDSKKYFYCDDCKDPEKESLALSSDKYPECFEELQGVNAEKIAALDLVLVAPRHLFRMPYSLHEGTALASVVIKKEQIDSFLPRDANPLGVKIIDYFPKNEPGEARQLLAAALEWKKNITGSEEKAIARKYSNYEKIDIGKVSESMFPAPIKKLLKGVKDGKKRGLFILITFFRSIGFSPEYINSKVREWNKLNEPPLKEGYIKSQIDWHLKQRKTILPPNYSNQSFYKDIGLLDNNPTAKNPVAEVARKIRKNQQDY